MALYERINNIFYNIINMTNKKCGLKRCGGPDLKIVDRICKDSELYTKTGCVVVHRVSFGCKKTINSSKRDLFRKRRRIIGVDKNGKNFALVPVKYNDKCPPTEDIPVSLLYCPPGNKCCCPGNGPNKARCNSTCCK